MVLIGDSALRARTSGLRDSCMRLATERTSSGLGLKPDPLSTTDDMDALLRTDSIESFPGAGGLVSHLSVLGSLAGVSLGLVTSCRLDTTEGAFDLDLDTAVEGGRGYCSAPGVHFKSWSSALNVVDVAHLLENIKVSVQNSISIKFTL
jgi:hypothetical protein